MLLHARTTVPDCHVLPDKHSTWFENQKCDEREKRFDVIKDTCGAYMGDQISLDLRSRSNNLRSRLSLWPALHIRVVSDNLLKT